MTKKKDNKQKAIGAENMLRFYDTDLIDRLNKRFNESGSRYENRNHFLTDLIEAGLNRREQEIAFKDKLVANETETYKSINAFAEMFLQFAEYVRTQFQAIGASDYTIKEILTATYNLSEAAALRKIVLPDSISKGAYDFMPERFKRSQETAGRIMIKDE